MKKTMALTVTVVQLDEHDTCTTWITVRGQGEESARVSIEKTRLSPYLGDDAQAWAAQVLRAALEEL